MLCVELLAKAIRVNPDIKGMRVDNEEIKISQYADDTVLYLEDDEKSLRESINTLHQFHQLSGLKMNQEKTSAVKFGGWRDNGIQLGRDLNLIWTNKFVSLGIYYDVTRIEETTELNVEEKI